MYSHLLRGIAGGRPSIKPKFHKGGVGGCKKFGAVDIKLLGASKIRTKKLEPGPRNAHTGGRVRAAAATAASRSWFLRRGTVVPLAGPRVSRHISRVRERIKTKTSKGSTQKIAVI